MSIVKRKARAARRRAALILDKSLVTPQVASKRTSAARKEGVKAGAAKVRESAARRQLSRDKKIRALEATVSSHLAERGAVARVGTANPVPDLTRLELRRQSVLRSTGAKCSIIEIGPAHNPILPRRDGYKTKNVDYLDRDGLIDKYKTFDQYDPNDIEDVDFVLHPGAEMGDEISERFDLVLASHVIEHTTSLVHFINECERLLVPGGTIALVVPDHRFCFDRFRQRSSLGRIIDAHDQPPTKHSVGTTIDFALNWVKHRDTTSWKPQHTGHYSFISSMDEVRTMAEESRTATEYIDMHNWVFSPHYLRLVLHDLAALGYISARESYFHPTVGTEFFINLESGGAGPDLSRRELVDLANAELLSLDVPTWEDGE